MPHLKQGELIHGRETAQEDGKENEKGGEQIMTMIIWWCWCDYWYHYWYHQLKGWEEVLKGSYPAPYIFFYLVIFFIFFLFQKVEKKFRKMLTQLPLSFYLFNLYYLLIFLSFDLFMLTQLPLSCYLFNLYYLFIFLKVEKNFRKMLAQLPLSFYLVILLSF